MQTLTNAELINLRSTLRSLKENNAFDHARLAYAADKTLREANNKLETYDEHQQTLMDEHTHKDDEGRKQFVTSSGETVVRDEEEGVFVTLDGEEYGTPEEVQEEGARFDLDVEAYTDEINELQNEEVSVDIHQVDEELLFENMALNGSHAEVDLGTLDPMIK